MDYVVTKQRREFVIQKVSVKLYSMQAHLDYECGRKCCDSQQSQILYKYRLS